MSNPSTFFENCSLCPRQCRADRANGQLGYCGETQLLRVADIEAHFGEEPPISGPNGSGTVFFTGCTLQCEFCQNFQISIENLGATVTVEQVVLELERLHRVQGIHNVNFVTPDHFFPWVIEITEMLRERGILIPTVFNVSGYQALPSLRLIEPIADIYLPDYKYSDSGLARRLAQAADYPLVALSAIQEMVHQKGFLQTRVSGENSIAERGVLVRHLILPGQVQNSLDALTTLFLELGRHLPISLMSQYTPTRCCRQPGFEREVTEAEFRQVYDHAIQLGFETMYVQFPEAAKGQRKDFLPDFIRERPFVGNIRT